MLRLTTRIITSILVIVLSSPVFSMKQDSTRSFRIEALFDAGINIPVRLTNKYITDDVGPFRAGASWSAGAGFTWRLSAKYGIEGAAYYSRHKVRFELSPPIYDEPLVYDESFSLISIPANLKRYFPGDWFAAAGVILDLQFSGKPKWIDPQSGFGLAIGGGKEFVFKAITISLAPNLKLHALIPFDKVDYHQRLLEVGLKVGLGFRFD